MFTRTPLGFLTTAVAFSLLGGVCLLAALLLVGAAQTDSVVPRLDPTDDMPWVRIAATTVSLTDIEAVYGEPRETALLRLGPPARVKRGWLVPAGCVDVYVYPIDVAGARAAASLCISAEGRVGGLAAELGGLSFDLRTVCGGTADMSGAALVGTLVGLPVASVLGWRRRRPPRFIGISLGLS